MIGVGLMLVLAGACLAAALGLLVFATARRTPPATATKAVEAAFLFGMGAAGFVLGSLL